MSGPIPAYQVAICDQAGRPRGSGLRIDDRHILTCAHVVNAALGGRDLDSQDQPATTETVGVKSLPFDGHPSASAAVVEGAWRPITDDPAAGALKDLAVLRLTEPLASPAVYARFYPGRFPPSRFEPSIFGFPDEPEGTNTKLAHKGEIANGLQQFDVTQDNNWKELAGFSGGPIKPQDGTYTHRPETVFGLFSTRAGAVESVGFATPSTALLAFLGEVFGEQASRYASHGRHRGVQDLSSTTNLLERKALIDRLVERVLGDDDALGIVALRGMGGIGKTFAAALLAHDERVTARFFDGIYWVTVGQQAGAAKDRLEALLKDLDESSADRTTASHKERLTQAVQDRSILIVVDDIWTSEAVRTFAVDRDKAPHCRILFTSRRKALFESDGITTESIDLLSHEEAWELFRLNSGIDPETVSIADRIVGECKGLALGLTIVAAVAKKHPDDLQDILDDLTNAEVREIEAEIESYIRTEQGDENEDTPENHVSIYGILNTSYRKLAHKETTQALLASLAVFPEDQGVPMPLLIDYGKTVMNAGRQVSEWIDDLDDHALIERKGDMVTFHDLQHDFIRYLGKDAVVGQHGIIADRLTADGRGPWAIENAAVKTYAANNLSRHLREAGRIEDLFALLTDTDWMGLRIKEVSVDALVRDFDEALRASGHDVD